jgi:hypothetical protein
MISRLRVGGIFCLRVARIAKIASTARTIPVVGISSRARWKAQRLQGPWRQLADPRERRRAGHQSVARCAFLPYRPPSRLAAADPLLRRIEQERGARWVAEKALARFV